VKNRERIPIQLWSDDCCSDWCCYYEDWKWGNCWAVGYRLRRIDEWNWTIVVVVLMMGKLWPIVDSGDAYCLWLLLNCCYSLWPWYGIVLLLLWWEYFVWWSIVGVFIYSLFIVVLLFEEKRRKSIVWTYYLLLTLLVYCVIVKMCYCWQYCSQYCMKTDLIVIDVLCIISVDLEEEWYVIHFVVHSLCCYLCCCWRRLFHLFFIYRCVQSGILLIVGDIVEFVIVVICIALLTPIVGASALTLVLLLYSLFIDGKNLLLIVVVVWYCYWMIVVDYW